MTIELEKGAKIVTLPAGAYIVGDPCYHVPDDQWDRVLEESNFFEGQCWATFRTHDGRDGIVVAFSTAYGDGMYTDGAGREYGVDAGLIGLISVMDVHPSEFDDRLAHAIQFKSPVRCFEHNGVITFGHVDIDTDSDEEVDRDFDDDDFFTGDGE